jgi:hypothetical protein
VADSFPKLLTIDVPELRLFAFNAANTLLAVGSDEDRAVAFELADGHEVARIDRLRLSDLNTFEFFGDKLLAIRKRACVFFDVRRGEFEEVFGAEEGVSGATIDPTGRLLAVGLDRALILYDLRERAVRHHLRSGVIDGAPVSPCFSPGGRYVAADFKGGDAGGFVLVWDTTDGRRWRTLDIAGQGDMVAAFRGDTPAFVYGSNGGLDLYEPDRGDEPAASFNNPVYPLAAAFRDGGRTLAAVGYEEALVVIDVATGRVIRSVDRPDGRQVSYSAPSPDWSLIASATEGGVLVWPSGLGAAAAPGATPDPARR